MDNMRIASVRSGLSGMVMKCEEQRENKVCIETEIRYPAHSHFFSPYHTCCPCCIDVPFQTTRDNYLENSVDEIQGMQGRNYLGTATLG